MFNFALFLVIATFVTGIIWLLDKYLFEAKRIRESEELKEYKEPILVEYSKAFFPVLLIVLILRSFIMEPFRIPSGSMLPTLLVGDFILVNKFAYGLRLPVTNTKIIPIGDPERGDVVVFKYPEDPRVDYIKRLVGVPGDRIRYVNKVLYVNDEKVAHNVIGPYHRQDSRRGKFYELKEDLVGVPHNILLNYHRPESNFEIMVPEGHYFMMGDNRDDSRDSRAWGFLPEENLVGKAVMVWMHWDFNGGGSNWGRIGTSIK